MLLLPFHSSQSLSPHSKLDCLETRLPTSILLHFTVSFWRGIRTNKPERYLSLFVCLLQWEQKAVSTAVDEKAGYQPSSLFPFAFHKGKIIFPPLFPLLQKQQAIKDRGHCGFYWLMVWWFFWGPFVIFMCFKALALQDSGFRNLVFKTLPL